MKEQNFKNHTRISTWWHLITPSIMLIILIGCIWNLWRSWQGVSNRLNAALLFLLFVLGCLLYWYSRYFALRAQDRAIRAEENFRHYILAGKPFDKKLRMSQIIALRFASDEEFITLAKKAIDENLRAKQIKESITEWKADHNRV